MKTKIILSASILALAVSAGAQTTETEWKAAAVKKYPLLGVKGSVDSGAFWARVKELRAIDAAILNRADWAMSVADDLALKHQAELRAKEQAAEPVKAKPAMTEAEAKVYLARLRAQWAYRAAHPRNVEEAEEAARIMERAAEDAALKLDWAAEDAAATIDRASREASERIERATEEADLAARNRGEDDQTGTGTVKITGGSVTYRLPKTQGAAAILDA